MRVQFKDIEVKPLKSAPKLKGRFATTPGVPETTAAIPRRPPKPPQ
jgi:hypothetical protein